MLPIFELPSPPGQFNNRQEGSKSQEVFIRIPVLLDLFRKWFFKAGRLTLSDFSVILPPSQAMR
jgi:hypothetical protein